jgi:hypothetical protein
LLDSSLAAADLVIARPAASATAPCLAREDITETHGKRCVFIDNKASPAWRAACFGSERGNAVSRANAAQ